MHKVKKILCQLGLSLSICCASSGHVIAVESSNIPAKPFVTPVTVTKDNKVSTVEVEKFVIDAKAFAISKGKDQALKAFMDPNNTQFRKDNLYIFAFDFSGVCLAHIKSAMVGSKMLDLKDQDGVSIIKDLINAAKNDSNGGWTTYRWQNPINSAIEKKYSYAVKVDDNWWIGAGIYESEKK